MSICHRMVLFFFVCLTGMAAPCYSQQEMPPEKLFLMSMEELMNVEVITAGKHIQKVKDIPASVVVITRQEIERFGYTSLEEIFRNTPGLYTINDLAYADDVIGIRGYWSYEGNVIIMVNGVENVNDVYDSYSLRYNGIPPEAIDRIEIVRGPMSVMYGSGAFFGAINIITNQRNKNKDNNLISVSYGTQNTQRVIARVTGQENDLSFTFNGGMTYSQGPNVPLSRMASDPSTYAGVPDNTKGRLEKWVRYCNISTEYRGLSIHAAYTSTPLEEYFFFPTADDGYLAVNDMFTLSPRFQWQAAPQLTLTLKGGYRRSHTIRRAEYFHPDYRGQELIDVHAMTAEINGLYTPSPNLELFMGAFYSEINQPLQDLNHPELDIYQLQWHLGENEKIQTQALFSRLNYRIHPSINLSAGLRLERLLPYSLYWSQGPVPDVIPFTRQDREYDEDQMEVIPRFAAIVELAPRHIMKFIYGKAINKPSFSQNIQQVYSSYSNLKPEYISTFEVIYQGALTQHLDAELNLFHNILDNLYTRVHYFDDDNTYRTYYGNGGKIITNGFEFLLKSRLLGGLDMEAAVSYQKSQDKRIGYEEIQPAYSPEWLGYLKAAYQLAPNLSLACYGYWVDEMEPLWEGPPSSIGNPPVPQGGRIAKSTERYINLSANLRMNNLFNRDFFFSLKGVNLLDTHILHPQFTNNQGWADKGNIGPVRAFLLTLGKQF